MHFALTTVLPPSEPSAAATISSGDITAPSWTSSWPEWAQFLVGKPLQILATIVIGLLLWRITRGIIDRWTRSIAEGQPWTKRTRFGRKIARTDIGSVLADASLLATDRRKQRARTIGSVARSTTAALIGLIVLFMVLDDLGVNTAALLASAGIAGVAIGFGAQSLVKDVLSGMFMLLEDQYGVGDIIDVGEATGTVEEVGLRVTKIRDASGALWFVPNGTIQRIANKTQGWAKAVVDVRLPFDQDVETARATMLRVAEELTRDDKFERAALSEPAIEGVEDLAGGAAQLRLTLRTAPAQQWAIARELRLRIAEAFRTDGIMLSLAPAPPRPPA